MSVALIVIVAVVGAAAVVPLAGLLSLHVRRRLIRASHRRVSARIAPPGRVLSHECTICGSVFAAFVEDLDRDETACPACGSLPGDRLLCLYLLNETDLISDQRPSRVSLLGLGDCWQAHVGAVFVGPGEAQVADAHDAVIAMLASGAEPASTIEGLGQQLKPGAWAVVHVRGAADAPERAEAVPDAAERLAEAGFQVTVDHYPRRLGSSSRLRFGLRDDDQILFCRKLRSARPGVIEHVWIHARDVGRPPPLPGRQPLFVGRIEEVRDGTVLGWAWSPSFPAERVRVFVIVDGERVASAVASTIRPALAWAGVGDGRHVFQVKLPRRVAKRGLHQLRVEPEHGVALPSASNFKTTAPKQPKVWGEVEFAVEGSAFGRVERIEDGIVAGWVWSPEASTSKVGLRVLVDGRRVASGVAELPRSGLRVPEPDRGRYGFRIQLPRLAPGAHAVRVEVDQPSPRGAALALLPAVTFSAGAASSALSSDDVELVVENDFLGAVEAVRDHVVRGWAWNPARDNHRVRVRVLVDGREIGGAIAQIHDRALERIGIGDGKHAFRFELPARLASLGRHSLRVEAEDGAALPGCASFTIVEGIAQAAVEQEQRAPVLLGRVERVDNGAVVGWAMGARNRSPLGLRVLIDGREVCAGAATPGHGFLRRGSRAPGRRPFTIQLPKELAVAGTHRLRVETEAGAAVPAAGGFGTVADANGGRVWRETSFMVESAVLGRVEEVRGGVVSGWAWRPAAPHWRVAVRALLNGRAVASGVAELERPSLQAAGIGDGRYGFKLQLPVPEGEPPHRLRIEAEDVPLPPANAFGRARAQDTRWSDVSLWLDGSTEDGDGAAVVGQIECLGHDTVSGWACGPTGPEWRLWIRATTDGEESGAGYADGDSGAATHAGVGHGGHRFKLDLSPIPGAEGPRYLRVEAGRQVTLPVARDIELDGSNGSRIVVSPARYR